MTSEVIKRVREFDRYYTVWLEVMGQGYLGTELTWAESRALFEVYLCPGISATGLCEHLNMDKSYMSRLLVKLERGGLLTRELVPGQKGLKQIRLTPVGEEMARQIDRNGDRQIEEKLSGLGEDTCIKLCQAMEFIQKVLSEQEKGGV